MSTNLPNLNQLSDHEFVLRVLKDSVPLMKPGANVDDYDLEPKNSFKVRTGYYVGQLLNQVERIDQAGILMNSYPRMRAWSKRYGRLEYFQYHMEQYVIAVAGMVDRLLLLVNHVYELGYDDECVRLKNVLKDLKKKDETDIIEMLNDLRMSTHSIKKSKNNYTHHVRFWEKELWLIGVREFALRNKTIEDEDGYLRQDLVYDTKLYRYRKMQLVAGNEKALVEKMGLIYDEIHKEYSARLDSATE